MKDILELLVEAQKTPIPNLLVIAGLLVLVLALVGKVGTLIELPRERQRTGLFAAAALIATGIILWLVPTPGPAIFSGTATPAMAATATLAVSNVALSSSAAPLPPSVSSPSPALATLSPVPPPTLTVAVPTLPPIAVACPIPVGPGFAEIWSRVRVRLGCPVNLQHTSDSVVEAFQRGHMVWRQDTNRLYAFAIDGRWFEFPNLFVEGIDPEYSCGMPSSPPSPVRGFSKVWCSQGDVRARLGDALDHEQLFCAGTNPCEIFQDFERGTIYKSVRFGKTFVWYADDHFWSE